MLTKNEINYIIYNNRSIKFVEQFLSQLNIDIKKFIEFEKSILFFRNLFKPSFVVDINSQSLNLEYEDILYTLDDIKKQTDIILESNLNIKNYPEYDYLIKRGFDINLINKYKLGAASYIKDLNSLIFLGVTQHPIFLNLFKNDFNAVLIPLFDKNNNLINCCNRKISTNLTKIKYSLAIPEINIWGIDNINENDNIWLTEGIFDCIALLEQNVKCVTAISASWSTIQLYTLINKNPKTINIFADYDYTGLKSAKLLQKIFNFYNINCHIYISKKYNDASEHFIENKLSFNEVEETAVTKELLFELKDSELDKEKDFLDYLKNRTF